MLVCLGVTHGSALGTHSNLCSMNHMGCWELHPGRQHARKVTFTISLAHLIFNGYNLPIFSALLHLAAMVSQKHGYGITYAHSCRKHQWLHTFVCESQRVGPCISPLFQKD